MKNTYRKLLILIAGVICMDSAISRSHYIIPDSMVVITANNQPIQNIQYATLRLAKSSENLKIYNLDDVDEFEKNFSQGFPANEEKAKKAFEARIKKIGKEQFNEKIIKAYQGLMVAFQYEVNRYPVIIFNKKTAIYGVTDLKQALQKYHDWQYKKIGASYE